MSSNPIPRDLRSYKTIPPPKLKKDYGGQLLRVRDMPPVRRYEGAADRGFKMVEGPDPLVPNNAVLYLHRRDTNGVTSKPQFSCRWLCPCCNHEHERIIPESFLAEGKAEFVEEDPFPDSTANPLIYLASPYSHDDEKIRNARWLAACDAAAWLMAKGDEFFSPGYAVFSPIAMGHPISWLGQDSGLGSDWQTWEPVNAAILNACTHVIILRLEGLEHSQGVKAEVDFARKKGLPIWGMYKTADGSYRVHANPQFVSAVGGAS